MYLIRYITKSSLKNNNNSIKKKKKTKHYKYLLK